MCFCSVKLVGDLLLLSLGLKTREFLSLKVQSIRMECMGSSLSVDLMVQVSSCWSLPDCILGRRLVSQATIRWARQPRRNDVLYVTTVSPVTHDSRCDLKLRQSVFRGFRCSTMTDRTGGRLLSLTPLTTRSLSFYTHDDQSCPSGSAAVRTAPSLQSHDDAVGNAGSVIMASLTFGDWQEQEQHS